MKYHFVARHAAAAHDGKFCTLVAIDLQKHDSYEPITTFSYTGVVTATEIKRHTDFMGQAIDYAVKKSG